MMIRKSFAMIVSTALLAALCISQADASLIRRTNRNRCSNRHVQRYNAQRHENKSLEYRRVRQVDGGSLWNLGKQNGQWPSLR